ncbi:MAG: hypothetical protein IKD39_03900 [Oscillospiraceae bacterium]|nr:hypothetical protein [Oscillospiraceae bacterium]
MKTAVGLNDGGFGIENAVFSVVRFVPFDKGTVDAGAATGVRKTFLSGTTRFLLVIKEMGL